jgi:hypothetical protein
MLTVTGRKRLASAHSRECPGESANAATPGTASKRAPNPIRTMAVSVAALYS